MLDLPLHFADGGKILVELAAVGGPEVASQLLRVLAYEIENAAAILGLPRARLRAEIDAVAEQPFEQRARIENRRQRLRLALPRQVVGVRAGVAGIAVARLARVLHADFERRETRRVGRSAWPTIWSHGDAGLDVDGGLLHLDAGEIDPEQRP